MRKNDRETARPGEQGFALVLALLALLLLTFLGLTLAVTTSTELQIATNYRWSRQAVYVAEAGIETGKAVLRQVAWDQIVPPARAGAGFSPWTGTTAPTLAGGTVPTTWSGNGTVNGLARRNFEGWQCDWKGDGMGYGVVLESGQAFQYVDLVGDQRLNGAFTLWVRRPLYIRPDGTITDWGANQTVPPPIGQTPIDNDNLVLVSEGVAPFTSIGAQTTSLAQSRAVHVIEVSVSHIGTTTSTECDTSRMGQQGLGPEGANFGGCRTLTADALGDAMRGAGGLRGGLSDTGAR